MKQPLVFLPTSLCAAGTTASESDLKELFQTCELSLTWRSKPMQLQTLSRKWKRDYWMRVLFSRTSSSFRIENYVTKLPSSVQGSLANHSAVQGNDKQQKTHDTCGPGSQMELQLCDHDMFGLKMSKGSSQLKQQTENRYLNMSSETWKKEVTAARGEYSQRLKSVHHTKENECSSLVNYPTPNASDEVKYRLKGNSQASRSLSALARKGELSKNWATPNTMDHLPPKTGEALARNKKKGGCKNLREDVNNPSMNWATPQASDHVEGARTATESNQKCLGRDLARLDGPQDPVSNSTSGKNQGSWGTPASNDANKTPHCEINSKQAGLTKSVGIAEAPQIGGKLNPAWVCQLMGLPSGWTNLGCWATE